MGRTHGEEEATRRWAYSPSPKAVTGLDATTKAQVEAKVRELIDEELKPKHMKPPPEDARFNYVTDIVPRWHGSTLFLVAVYACPGPNAISPSFESRFARIRPAGVGKFDLSFMRHTGKWVELFQRQTLEECLRGIRDDPWFRP